VDGGPLTLFLLDAGSIRTDNIWFNIGRFMLKAFLFLGFFLVIGIVAMVVRAREGDRD
jgi:hypothetical protein